jgi:hypothetical protein
MLRFSFSCKTSNSYWGIWGGSLFVQEDYLKQIQKSAKIIAQNNSIKYKHDTWD